MKLVLDKDFHATVILDETPSITAITSNWKKQKDTAIAVPLPGDSGSTSASESENEGTDSSLDNSIQNNENGTEGETEGNLEGGEGTEGETEGNLEGGEGTEGETEGNLEGGEGTESETEGNLEGSVEGGIEGGMEGGDFIGGDPGFDGMMGGEGLGTETQKDPLLSSWPFVIGITAASLVVGIGIGILLAKLRIKKGIEVYED